MVVIQRKRDRRRTLLPIIAGAFIELGYRRCTTAELARRCGVRENILYRLWPDKKAMFIAAIDYVYEFSEDKWKEILKAGPQPADSARRLLEYESRHHGEFGHYRIIFTGLAETDDPEICAALRRMYTRFQQFIQQQIDLHRRGDRASSGPASEASAWALIGLGTAANIGRELNMLTDKQRRELFTGIGRCLLGGEK